MTQYAITRDLVELDLTRRYALQECSFFWGIFTPRRISDASRVKIESKLHMTPRECTQLGFQKRIWEREFGGAQLARASGGARLQGCVALPNTVVF